MNCFISVSCLSFIILTVFWLRRSVFDVSRSNWLVLRKWDTVFFGCTKLVIFCASSLLFKVSILSFSKASLKMCFMKFNIRFESILCPDYKSWRCCLFVAEWELMFFDSNRDFAISLTNVPFIAVVICNLVHKLVFHIFFNIKIIRQGFC